MFWDNAKNLKDNQISNILSDKQGLYIIKLKELKPLDNDKFSNEKNTLNEKMLLQKKSDVLDEFVEALKKKAR